MLQTWTKTITHCRQLSWKFNRLDSIYDVERFGAMSSQDPSLNSIAKLMQLQFDDVKKKIEEQKQDFKDQLRKSDEYFDKRIDKFEEKFDKEFKEVNEKLGKKAVELAVLKNESERSIKNWGSIAGLIAGSIASIVVAIVTKILGF